MSSAACRSSICIRERLLAAGWSVANDSPLAVLDVIPPAELGDVRALVRRVVASGQAWVAPATFEGRDVVRICATHGQTGLEDIDALQRPHGRRLAAHGPNVRLTSNRIESKE
jgi:hypothetical protein